MLEWNKHDFARIKNMVKINKTRLKTLFGVISIFTMALSIAAAISGSQVLAQQTPSTPPEITGKEPIDSTTANNFDVKWYLVSSDIVDKTYVVSLQNLDTTQRTFGLSLFLRNTSFDANNLNPEDIRVEEWKNTPHTARILKTATESKVVITRVEDGSYPNGSIRYNLISSFEDVTYDKLVYEQRFFNDWQLMQNPTKQSETGRLKFKYKNINLAESTNTDGIKYFKVTVRTPLARNQQTGIYESRGILGFLDENTNTEYHPAFYSGWTKRRQLNLIANSTAAVPSGWTFNITGFDSATEVSQGDLQSDCDDIRVVINHSISIPIKVTGCDTPNTNLYFNFSHQIPVSQNYSDAWFYYGNSSAIKYPVANNTRTLDWPFDDDGHMLIHWTFDDIAGGLTKDSAGKIGHDLAVVTTAVSGTGCKFGGCIDTQGDQANSWINSTVPSEVQNTAITVDFWSRDDQQVNNRWLGGFTDEDGSPDQDLLRFGTNGPENTAFIFSGGTGVTINTGVHFPSSLTHVRLTGGTSAGAQLWWNATSKGTSGSTTQLSGATTTRVGRERQPNEYWDGIFDDWYVWDKDQGAPLYLASDKPDFLIGTEETQTTDSCTYSSGTWNVDCSDSCVIASSVNLNSNILHFNNNGTFHIDDNVEISKISRLDTFPGCKIIFDDSAKLIVGN